MLTLTGDLVTIQALLKNPLKKLLIVYYYKVRKIEGRVLLMVYKRIMVSFF